MCQHGIFKTFVSRTNESGCTFRLDCNCWSCSTCRSKLEADWNNHATNLFATCPDGIGYLCVQHGQLLATMKRLSRARAQYIRVRGHGIFHIYTTNLELAQKRLSQQQAAELFEEHVALAPAGKKHVISTSRAWSHSSRGEEDPRMESDSICIATGLGPDTIRAILDRLHQKSSVKADCLSFRFEAPEVLESFVATVKATACPRISYESKRTSKNSDKRQATAFKPSRFKQNKLFEPLHSP